jgi:hypothetical protein
MKFVLLLITYYSVFGALSFLVIANFQHCRYLVVLGTMCVIGGFIKFSGRGITIFNNLVLLRIVLFNEIVYMTYFFIY